MRRTLLLGLMVAGCSAEQTVAPQDDLATSLLADLSMTGALPDLRTAQAADLVASSSYPAGPYGNKVGDTIAMLSWEGYADPLADAVATTKTYGPYSMNDLRMSGRPYAVVHVAEFF
jgi:hypothetical protein